MKYVEFLETILYSTMLESGQRLLYKGRAMDMLGAIDRWRYIVWDDPEYYLYDGYKYEEALEVLFKGYLEPE